MRILAVALVLLLFQAGVPAAIEGVITAAENGRPIAGAQVTLRRAGAPSTAPAAATTTTTADGVFSLVDVAAGSYTLTVVSNGYVRQSYGERFPGASALPLVLAEGQRLRDVNMQLVQAGNVEGTIRTAKGLPAIGVTVRLVRQAFTETGQRIFDSAAVGRTDDRGRYRFYWVTPGRYFVLAGVASFGPDIRDNSGNEIVDIYSYTFFPGTTEFEKALAIDIRPGGDLTGTDFALPESRGYRIRARIVDPDTGQPPPQAFASISYWSPNGGGGMGGGDMYKPDSGVMEFSRVLPGIYSVGVTAYEGPGIPTRAMSRTSSGNSVGADVVISNADVDLGVLRLQPPKVLTARLTGDSVPAGVSSPVRIYLLAPGSAMRPQQETFRDGAVLTLFLPHADVRVAPAALPEDFYIREVRLDGHDALTQAAPVTSTGDLQIVLSSRAGRVQGIVRDQNAQPVHGARVVLVPNTSHERFELFKQVVSTEDGQFVISGIAPGDYTLHAWEKLDPYGYFDPEVLRRAAGTGVAMSITEAARETVELRAIPAGQE